MKSIRWNSSVDINLDVRLKGGQEVEIYDRWVLYILRKLFPLSNNRSRFKYSRLKVHNGPLRGQRIQNSRHPKCRHLVLITIYLYDLNNGLSTVTLYIAQHPGSTVVLQSKPSRGHKNELRCNEEELASNLLQSIWNNLCATFRKSSSLLLQA